MSDDISYFGIRHHGPGCARSLLKALEAQRPDCVLIEGPAGCEALLAHLADAQMQPPVALLSHSVDEPQWAVFHPFAVFSPEWQALRWALQAKVPVRFIDVSPGVSLAWQRQARQAAADQAPAAPESTAVEASNDDAAIPCTEAEPSAAAPTKPQPPHDPLDWLAMAAGYDDGESWWNQMVEERCDGSDLFAAIAQAMTELRENAHFTNHLDARHEAIREAHMRCMVRETRQQYQRIAVVCGAWHVPALAGKSTASADQRLLKGLEKLKAQTTWVPWTYRHLSLRSGYGAGIASPGWYEHLWHSSDGRARSVGWFARVAHLLREHELDCSSAHLIEATRLADTLASLRGRPAPGLDELNEATRCVICNGDDMPMRLVAAQLMLGNALGTVPADVPSVPLQRDLQAQQKRLRMKPEALSRRLDLDLRNDTDLQRSHLLHRLGLLDIGWGRLATLGRSARGTFHELWDLAWEPRFEVDLIVASRFGHTLELAASTCAVEHAHDAAKLADVAALVDRVLLANLPHAIVAVAQELEERAATDGDPLSLLSALPALANIYRYGNVRQTDGTLVAHLFDSILLRAGIGVAVAVNGLNGEAAERARETLLAVDRAVGLRQGDEQTAAWRHSLRIIAMAENGTPLLRGLCTRLLLDATILSGEEASRLLGLNLSQGRDALEAAQWLDGFLNRNATVLLHDDALWSLIDHWLSTLHDEHFMRVVPLVRRTFAQFEAADRRDLGERVKRHGDVSAEAAVTTPWNESRAARALPMLRELLGMNDGQC
ncbi:DUF5682 family protein [Dyella choica]|uniref:4-aminobutyrate aminotransferase n=1 Tax=Dyella choica TaxID=1927959 RepID=A0A432M646_9GAMM|nr:DUF5682 family protein [Dyella choica]RUL75911.1 hypothetical protein EKH80_09285 [Dyella choica]